MDNEEINNDFEWVEDENEYSDITDNVSVSNVNVEDVNVQEEDVDEIDIELIRLVKNNPGLWNKSSKTYSNAIEKDKIWEYVGLCLPIKMTGKNGNYITLIYINFII